MSTKLKELAGYNFDYVFFGRHCTGCGGSGFIQATSANTPEPGTYGTHQVKCPACLNGHWLKQVPLDKFLDALMEDLHHRIASRMAQELLVVLTPRIAQELTTSHRAHFFDEFVKEVEDRIKNVECQIMDAKRPEEQVPRVGDHVMVKHPDNDTIKRAEVKNIMEGDRYLVEFGPGHSSVFNRVDIISIESNIPF